jgi:drug/metabolite transporter superfamily protein YnfA
MRTHPFDAVSFVFGAIFTVVALLALTGIATITLLDLRWLGPAALVLIGVVLVVSAARRDTDELGARVPEHDEHV